MFISNYSIYKFQGKNTNPKIYVHRLIILGSTHRILKKSGFYAVCDRPSQKILLNNRGFWVNPQLISSGVDRPHLISKLITDDKVRSSGTIAKHD